MKTIKISTQLIAINCILIFSILSFQLQAQIGCDELCGQSATVYGFHTIPYTASAETSMFGSFAGNSTTGVRNSFFGYLSGYNNTSGKDNCFFGSHAGASTTIGEKNVYIGQSAGTNLTIGQRNICIGFRSGPAIGSEDLSDRLFIDVVKSDTPLIYGEFDNDHVKINGTFEVTAGISNPSSSLLKKDFTPVNSKEILDKLSNLSIDQWVYKHRENELHIGPVAEEFYETFGLGSGSTQISTIDSDGIALLSIQALKAENDELKQLIKSLQCQVNDIRKN